MKFKHLCNTCVHKKLIPICIPPDVKWSIDINSKLKGKEADKIVECILYYKKDRK
jgi:hypothetical protein